MQWPATTARTLCDCITFHSYACQAQYAWSITLCMVEPGRKNSAREWAVQSNVVRVGAGGPETGIKYLKASRVFLTAFDGARLFGLPGLLCQLVCPQHIVAPLHCCSCETICMRAKVATHAVVWLSVTKLSCCRIPET